MRRRTLLRLLAAEFFARLWNAPAWAQQWREYRNDEGGYRIDLPGQPKITSEAEGSDGTDKRTTVELDVDDLTSPSLIGAIRWK